MADQTCHVHACVHGTVNFHVEVLPPVCAEGHCASDLCSGKNIMHSGLQTICWTFAYGPQGTNWLHDTTSSLCF